MVEAAQMPLDRVTWNGYAGRYETHPLVADPGETVRVWVVDAGPSLREQGATVTRGAPLTRTPGRP